MVRLGQICSHRFAAHAAHPSDLYSWEMSAKDGVQAMSAKCSLQCGPWMGHTLLPGLRKGLVMYAHLCIIYIYIYMCGNLCVV